MHVIYTLLLSYVFALTCIVIDCFNSSDNTDARTKIENTLRKILDLPEMIQMEYKKHVIAGGAAAGGGRKPIRAEGPTARGEGFAGNPIGRGFRGGPGGGGPRPNKSTWHNRDGIVFMYISATSSVY